MNRGSMYVSRKLGISFDASMRPRFMNRGSRTAHLGHPLHVSASMRPRFMNRGSKVGGATASGTGKGFNEAPIHESGK